MPKSRKPKPERFDYHLHLTVGSKDAERARQLASLWECNVSQVVRRLLLQASEREGLT
jgi:hypothetical protein